MSGHHKRTKKDVEEAYRRGFEAGFNVRPNPVAMFLRAIWRKHELKKLKKEWKQHYQHDHTRPIGIMKNLREDEKGLHAEIEFGEPNGK